MSRVKIWFIKPPPPSAVLAGRNPVAEEPRYDWEPLGLELLALRLRQAFPESVTATLWHLRSGADESALMAAYREGAPDVVAFGEIDLYVSSVSRIAAAMKRIERSCLTIVGGKQASLLRPGDRSPFAGMDFIVGGCGVAPFREFVASLLDGRIPAGLSGQVRVGADGRVASLEPRAARDGLGGIAGEELREIPLRPFARDEYFARLQRFASPAPHPQRTASVLWSTGCSFDCGFCQSPMEREGEPGPRLVRRPTADIAAEIEWLSHERGVNSIFAVAANLDLQSVMDVYELLAERGATSVPIAGFVRAADAAAASRSGLLARLAAAGLGLLSVGWDLALRSGSDEHGKGFAASELEECLEGCRRAGLPLAITVLGDSRLPIEALGADLSSLVDMPVLSVDVRMATAFRGTRFFRENRGSLAEDPDANPAALDRNNYRWVTLGGEGSASPREAAKAAADFELEFEASRARDAYARDLLAARPDLAPLFSPRYASLAARGPLSPESAAVWRTLFRAERENGSPDYDEAVAEAYDRAFSDIRARRAEWGWIERRLDELQRAKRAAPRVLEIGCGTGALLRAIGSRASVLVGADVSEPMLARGRSREALELSRAGVSRPRIEFIRARDASLPLADGSFDLVISFLSYRYLDWDSVPSEILRLLAPGGRFLCVDMVGASAGPLNLPRLARDALAERLGSLSFRGFRALLVELSRLSDWQAMRRANPPRALSAMAAHAAEAWGSSLETLSIGRRSRIVAFSARKGETEALRGQ